MVDYSKFPNLHPSIQNGRKLPIRSAFIQFYEGDEKGEPKGGAPITTLNGLNIKFSVEENWGNRYPMANIGVCNVKGETRDFLTNYMNFANLQWNKRILRLYAGYLEEGQSAKATPYLFGGNVKYTRFTEPPDIWINMEVVYKEIASALQIQEWTIKGLCNAEEVLAECAKRLNVGLDIRDTPPNSIRNFRASGDGKRLLRKLRNCYPGYAVFITADNKLTVTKYDRDKPKPGETIWAVREDTGMLGIPSVEYWGVDVSVLLNPEIQPGDWIHLVSANQPTANGLYRIWKLNHTGELRGNEFCTQISACYPKGDKSKK